MPDTDRQVTTTLGATNPSLLSVPPDEALSVVIVNYQAYDALTTCLESLEPSLGSIAVVVVDHESNAAAAGKLERRFPWVRLVAVPDNPGFAAGVNRGVAETAGRYVLLLNPDCVVHGDVIRPLAAWLESEPRLGACGAVVRERDGTLQASARRFPTVTTGFAGRTSWLTRAWPQNPWSRSGLRRTVPDTPVAVDWVSGACMMIRRSAFDAVGGMDEQFFLYWEDADFCLRLRQAGWRTDYNPSASVTHLTGESSKRARRASLVAFHASAYRYYRKHGGRAAAWLAPFAFVALRVRLLLKLFQTSIRPSHER
jgi:GT2 family glycosyltransferase